MTSDSLLDHIRTRYETFVRDLETIVNIDSSSDDPDGIAAVASIFQPRFEAMGFKTVIHRMGRENIPCLEAVNHDDEMKSDVMCLGHMDTVFPPGEVARRGFSIQGRRAFGPGVCDMKGGLVTALHALESLAHEGLLAKLKVRVAFNGDEETGSWASRAWVREMAKQSRRVLVFEPCRPGYGIVLGRKGGGWFTVTAQGTAAHAGAEIQKGANAVVGLAAVVTRIHNELNRLETGTSAQVTVIKGGDKINIIPALATASVDVRIEQTAEKERVETFFKALSQAQPLPGVHLSVSGEIDRPPMVAGPDAMALWDVIVASAQAVGITPKEIYTGGCSDGNFTSAQGIPTIDGMGLVGTNSHREDEYVELDAVVPMVSIVAGTLRSLIPVA